MNQLISAIYALYLFISFVSKAFDMFSYRYLVFILVFICRPLLGQDLSMMKDSLAMNLSKTERSQLIDRISDEYIGKEKLNRDSLRKYNDMQLDLIKDRPLDSLLTRAKEKNLVANYRLPYEEYRELAEDLIEDYQQLNRTEDVLNEYYYIALKAHTAGSTDAVDLYKKGLQLIDISSRDLSPEAKCQWEVKYLSSYGSNYEYLGLYDQALKTVESAVQKAEACQDSVSMMRAYRTAGATLGNVLQKKAGGYEGHNILTETLESYLKKTYELAQSLDHPMIYPLAAYNLANYYNDVDSTELAVSYVEESQRQPNIAWMPMQRYYNQMLLSDIYGKKGDQGQSYEFLQEAVASAAELKEERHDFLAQMDLAEWYIKYQYPLKAIEALRPISRSMMNNIEFRRKYHNLSQEAYAQNGQYEEAYRDATFAAALQDSIQSQETNSQIATLIDLMRKSEDEKEIAMLSSQNLQYRLRSRTLAFGGLSLLFLGLGYWYFSRQRYERKILAQEKEKSEIEDRLFRSQMNPHFIFNTLGSIQGLLLEKESSDRAAYFIAKFAKLMRQILVQSQQVSISLREEVDTINTYLMLQKMRFEDRFDYDIRIADELDADAISIPPMILQPIIENAIEHGKVHTIADGKVDVSFESSEGMLKVAVTDNGVGMDQLGTASILQRKSMALRIIKDRLNYLSSQLGQHVGMDFIKPPSGRGTTVLFNLPSLSH